MQIYVFKESAWIYVQDPFLFKCMSVMAVCCMYLVYLHNCNHLSTHVVRKITFIHLFYMHVIKWFILYFKKNHSQCTKYFLTIKLILLIERLLNEAEREREKERERERVMFNTILNM